jgi:sulfatase maturation enzyme AslB (radical SAM superfamily)
MNLRAGIESDRQPSATFARSSGTALGCLRDFLDNRFVYTVVSPRARGLSVGVNLNPDKFCNFDCVYCEVNRSEPAQERL